MLYEQNPKFCKHCGKPLPWEKRRNVYCSSSCSAMVNNKNVNRHKQSTIAYNKNNIKAYQCSDEDFKKYIENFQSWKELYALLGYSNGRSDAKKQIFRRCDDLGLSYPQIKDRTVVNKTKGDLFKDRKNWQSARSDIRKQADRVFEKSGIEYKCWLCGYDKHIEIAHIKAVSDFDDSSLISEINDIHNLIPLCPNHHWEFDHNCLSEENIKKIEEYKNN